VVLSSNLCLGIGYRELDCRDFPQFLHKSYVTVFLIDKDGFLSHFSNTYYPTILSFVDICGYETENLYE
jgi:hypothetical protein